MADPRTHTGPATEVEVEAEADLSELISMASQIELNGPSSSSFTDTSISNSGRGEVRFPEGTIRDVAVVGFGACGAAALNMLIHDHNLEGHPVFHSVVAYERRSSPGGLWNYSETAGVVYDDLHTNVPVAIMPYHHTRFHSSREPSVFATRSEVLDLVSRYSRPIEKHVVYGVEVVDVTREDGSVASGERGRWRLSLHEVGSSSGDRGDVHYRWADAVVLATGNYDVPYMPSRPGLAQWAQERQVLHSCKYRHAETFRGRSVLVVGGGASAIDICRQLKSQDGVRVIQSTRSNANTVSGNIEHVDDIASFDTARGVVTTVSGAEIAGVDVVLFCTGYVLTYPMLNGLREKSLLTDGKMVHNLHRLSLSIEDPSLCFVGLPKRVVPLRMAEVQGAFISRVLSGKMRLPSEKEMWKQYRSDLEAARIEGDTEGRSLVELEYPRDVDFSDGLLNDIEHADREYFGTKGPNYNSKWAPERWNDRQRMVRAAMARLKAYVNTHS